MNGAWSFYDPATGRLVGRTFSGPVEHLQANTPAGLAAVPGEHNHETHRVTLATGEVERWREARPSDDHEWDSASGSWVVSRAAQKRAALERIHALELQQLRPMRELLADPESAIARERVRRIDDEISILRAVLARTE